MNTKTFTIFDSKAEIFNTPFFYPQTSQARRAFGDLVNDSKTAISLHPEDYTLFEVAEFDDQTGIVTPHETPKSLGLGVEFKITLPE